MRALSVLAALAFASACTSTPDPAPVAPTSPPPQASCPEVPGAAPQAALAVDVSDPDIEALAAAAEKCSFESASFDWSCPAFKEWRSENDDLFEGPSGNATILRLLESTDIKKRALATERGFTAARTFFSEAPRAKRLLGALDKERESRLLPAYGKFAAYVDGSKMLGDELRALAKHPASEVRRAFAEHVLPQHPTPFSLELTKTLIEDADGGVRRAAIRSLSANGRTRASDGVCATLKAQLSRTDKLIEDVVDAGSTSKCPGMNALVVAEVEKRAADIGSAPASGGPSYQSALSTLCWRDSTPAELKKRAFEVALKITPKLTDGWQKRWYLGLFRTCDLTRAKAALTPYLKDKDKDVAERAKEELDRVEEELKSKP